MVCRILRKERRGCLRRAGYICSRIQRHTVTCITVHVGVGVVGAVDECVDWYGHATIVRSNVLPCSDVETIEDVGGGMKEELHERIK